MNDIFIRKYLEDLLKIASPTGYTDNIADYIKRKMQFLNIDYKIGNKGNILVKIDGIEKSNITTFIIHMDTLGAVVTYIKENGKLCFDIIGGYMVNSIEGENCVIHTRENKYDATVQTIKSSIHVYSKEAYDLPREIKNYEVIIDEDVKSKEDVINLGIDVGDIISFDTRSVFLDNGYIKSRYLDDKTCVAVVLYLLEIISKKSLKLKNTTYFLFTNYEEVGHGSNLIPYDTKNIIALDLGCVADIQNSLETHVSICAKDSNGPYDYNLTGELIDICKKNSIDYKIDTYPDYGSDTMSALMSGIDARFALFGPGISSSHGYERTHIKSLVQTYKLILNYILI